MNKILRRWHDTDPSLKLFLLGVMFLGINSGIVSGAFNNYLHDVYELTSQQRGILEFPREFPGFALVFMTGFLAFLSVEKWAVLTGIFAGTGLLCLAFLHRASHVAQLVKHLPAMRETWVQLLGREVPLEKEMAIHSSSLAWRIPWNRTLPGYSS